MNEWRPHPKQEKALLSTAFETLYGGARGGGKTDTGMAWLLYDKDNPRYKALVIRQNSTDLTDWVDRARVMYSGTGAKFAYNPCIISFPSGAKIYTGHLKDENAYEKYQGHEYHRMLIEELTQIPSEERYLKLISSCRSTVDGLPARVFATANPGGVGHTWVKKRFIDPSKPNIEFKDEVSGRTRVFIPATVDDNPTLVEKDPEYIKFLESLPHDLKRQWRHGDWADIAIKGAYYQDDINHAQREGRICRVPHNYNLLVHTSWDLGIKDTQPCIFFQLDNNDIKIINYHQTDNKGYDYYLKMLRDYKDEHHYNYGTMFLPHDGTQRSKDTLKSFEDVLKNCEEQYLTKVIERTKNKVVAIQKSRTIFPRCWFDAEKCSELLNALTNYRRIFNEKKNMLEDNPYHDWASHPADAFQVLAEAVPEKRLERRGKDAFQSYLERKRKQ